MSNKFTTLVTNEGINLLQASSQQDKKIEFVKAIGSSTAYSTSQLSTVTYADVMALAAKNQEGTVNNIVPDKTTTKMELLFDGHDVKSDYTLNSIFLISKLKDSSDYKVFAVLKANQPQYINAYTGDGATNLQINVGLKFDNQDNVSLEINSAALATMGDLQNLSKSTAEKLASENTRATESEQALAQLIKAETKRASDAESTLRSETTAESNRAKGVEQGLDNKVTSETARATKAENDLAGKVTSEQNRAMAKENSLDGKIGQVQTNLNAEQGRATGAEQKLDGRVDTEIARATKAEGDIQNQVNAEKSRATAAEGNLNKTITDESNRAKGAESSLSGKVDSETARAAKAENDLAGKITSEQNRAIAKENDLDGKIQSVKGDIDSIKVGGKNMFHDTSMMTNPSYWNLRGAKVKKAFYGDVTHESANFTGVNNVQAPSSTFIDYVPKTSFATNTFYTLSYWCTSAIPKNAYLNKDDGGGHYHLNNQQTITTLDTGQRFNGWSRMAVTFKPTVRDAYITFDISNVGWASSFQLEESTLPSPWGPSANDIENMVSDAKNTLQSETTAESNRAKGVESSLQSQINTEKSRAQGAESNLSNQINAEANRAKGVENELRNLANLDFKEVKAELERMNGSVVTIPKEQFTKLNGVVSMDLNACNCTIFKFNGFALMQIVTYIRITMKAWTYREVVAVPIYYFNGYSKFTLLGNNDRITDENLHYNNDFHLSTGTLSIYTRGAEWNNKGATIAVFGILHN
ncbi:hypothetical protein AYP73_07360 [Ligilactobacillus agilis]|uniref:hypothetical protein n=2 Tax=Ligilactobacillus agilis TaxID=1601 RepID=UPI000B8C2B8D|nr:hypothetical protein [Ligilactobacillus agilis]OXS50043.1 hypothetical protein AYP73_07360 [Ligilactobacillus agilis]